MSVVFGFRYLYSKDLIDWRVFVVSLVSRKIQGRLAELTLSLHVYVYDSS